METLLFSTAGKGRRRKVRKLAAGRDNSDPQLQDPNQMGTAGKPRRGKVRKLADISDPKLEDPNQMGTAGKSRWGEVRKLAGGRDISDPQLEDPNQMEVGGSEGCQDPSVYLAVRRGHWFSSKDRYFPLHKFEVASDDDSEVPEASHVTNMTTDIGFKTFVAVQSRWIVGVGGDPGRTAIFDTKTAKVLNGPKLVAAKLCPVVVAVGYRVYALSESAHFTQRPDYKPLFESLDLSKAMDAEGNLSLLAQCSWKALPCPLFFPHKLPMAAELLKAHVIAVTSHVVVGHYILLSVREPRFSNCKSSFNSEVYHNVTYAFDTKLEEWHKVDADRGLPFFGSATPLGRSGRIFLGLSRKNGPVSVYRICVSTSSSSSSTAAAASDKDGTLKVSITVFSIKDKAHEQVSAETGHYFTSLDGTCFSTLFHSHDNRQCYKKFCKETGEFYSMMLDAKLRTYEIESASLVLLEALDEEKLLAVKPEIAVSSQREQVFTIFSAQGFNSPPITFVASI